MSRDLDLEGVDLTDPAAVIHRAIECQDWRSDVDPRAVLAALSDAGIELATRTHNEECCGGGGYLCAFSGSPVGAYESCLTDHSDHLTACPGVLVPLSESPNECKHE